MIVRVLRFTLKVWNEGETKIDVFGQGLVFFIDYLASIDFTRVSS